MTKLKTLVILCGGTGGHFFPGLSVARLFKSEGGTVYLITGSHKVSYAKEFSPKYNIPIYEVQSAAPSFSLLFLYKTVIGFIQSIRIFLKTKPDAVLAMGSYTSIPSSLAAIILRIPLFLHDGNSVIGKANRFLSRWAKAIMSAFPPNNKNFDCSKVITAGMPLRPEIIDTKVKNKNDAIDSFNKLFNNSFKSNIPTILVFGGSLGAKKINTCVPEALKSYSKLQIIHLTGKEHFTLTLELYKLTHNNYIVLENFDDMALLYMIADIVICRSGGSSVYELYYFDKNSILIPYHLAAENHQFFNALFLQRQNSNTLILEDKECSVKRLKHSIENLLNRPHHTVTRKDNPSLFVLSVIRTSRFG